jgi:hypothetical protein
MFKLVVVDHLVGLNQATHMSHNLGLQGLLSRRLTQQCTSWAQHTSSEAEPSEGNTEDASIMPQTSVVDEQGMDRTVHTQLLHYRQCKCATNVWLGWTKWHLWQSKCRWFVRKLLFKWEKKMGTFLVMQRTPFCKEIPYFLIRILQRIQR